MASKRMMIIAVLVAAVVIVAAAAVALSTGSKATGGMTDALGRTVNVDANATRIVSCAPAITEMIYALGGGNRVVAVTDYCDYPVTVVQAKENETLKSIGNYKNPNFDKIVSMRSDLVILIKDAEGQPAMASKLDEAGIRNIVVYECTNLTKIYENIEMLGKALHLQSTADAKVLEMKAKMQYIETHLANTTSRPTVAFAVWLSPTYLAANGTFINDVLTIVGGMNSFAQSNGYPTVASEAILQANPDVIILTATMMATTELTPEQIRAGIMSDPILKETNAVKNGSVFILMHAAEDIFLRPSPRTPDVAGLLARMLFPANFGGAIPYIIEDDYQSYLPSYNSG